MLKRTLSGTYVSVEPFHLFRYLDEQAYRFNNRDKSMDDFDRFKAAAANIVGKRLTWDEATGKNHEPQTYPKLRRSENGRDAGSVRLVDKRHGCFPCPPDESNRAVQRRCGKWCVEPILRKVPLFNERADNYSYKPQ